MSENVKVGVSIDFFDAFAKLPRTIQGKVTEFVNKFKNDPTHPGINYEKINEGMDKKIYSVRIDIAYRGIVVRQPETGVYLLLWVDHHNEAYAWASRKKCEVNPKTGAVQIYEVQSFKDTVPAAEESSLFRHVSNDALLELGVPEELLPYIRSFSDKEKFTVVRGSLPDDVYEYLSWILEDIPVNEVLKLAREERGTNSKDNSLIEALDIPVSMRSFVIVNVEDELHQMMAEPLAKWRIFLHQTQRKIVNKNYSGAARVLGGAGTGKTVVAMHRAKHLAAALDKDQKILFTTFTANLAADIRDNLRKICTFEEMRKIEVINLDAWVNQFLRESGYNAEINYDDIDDLWEEAVALTENGLPFNADFYEEEWTRVVISQEALSLEKYIKANRNGRGTRLDRKKRILIWKVFEIYQNLMKEKQVRDINTAMYECRKLLESSAIHPKYTHIIVDEGQDFSDNAYRLLRTLAGNDHPNDLFIVGDAHQRIYRNRPTLSKCGIDVRGRSNTLRINYRTTEETRRFAFALLNGISFDDLDDGTDFGDECQSLTHGAKPVIVSFKDADAEFEYLLKEIKQLNKNGIALSDICVIARTNKLVDDYVSSFTKVGIKALSVKPSKADDRSFDGLRIATMHRVKGLEFQYVFIAAVNKNIVPHQSAYKKVDAVSINEALTAEKCLLYVALTRAQKGAYITSYGKISEFLT